MRVQTTGITETIGIPCSLFSPLICTGPGNKVKELAGVLPGFLDLQAVQAHARKEAANEEERQQGSDCSPARPARHDASALLKGYH